MHIRMHERAHTHTHLHSLLGVHIKLLSLGIKYFGIGLEQVFPLHTFSAWHGPNENGHINIFEGNSWVCCGDHLWKRAGGGGGGKGGLGVKRGSLGGGGEEVEEEVEITGQYCLDISYKRAELDSVTFQHTTASVEDNTSKLRQLSHM